MNHPIVSREEWLEARKALLARERAIDALRAERRRLPWVRIEKPYVFEGPEGEMTLGFGVSFTPEDRAAGRATYNYGVTTIQRSPDMFGVSIFVKDVEGDIFHSYSTYHRGTELLMGAFNWLDLTPKGRNEGGHTMSWVRLHDEY